MNFYPVKKKVKDSLVFYQIVISDNLVTVVMPFSWKMALIWSLSLKKLEFINVENTVIASRITCDQNPQNFKKHMNHTGGLRLPSIL
nr:hypothetical protein Iba_chr01bCG0940 [Ipomoea batatas]